MRSKEAEKKISSIKEMMEKRKHWKRCDRLQMAEINRTYVDAIEAEVLVTGVGRVEAEKAVIDSLGFDLVPFTRVADKHPPSIILSICVVWRWEASYAAKRNPKIAEQFKTMRMQLCAAANAPLWMGALYASEAVADVMTTKPTDF